LTFLKNISTDQDTDRELIAAFKQTGELHYLSTVYQRYMDLVFGVCLKYFKDAERSKDAVMDIYEELCKKLKQHEVDNFKGWLHVLARNYCLMQLRSRKIMLHMDDEGSQGWDMISETHTPSHLSVEKDTEKELLLMEE
jgi:RNA polymerase sigma-70 factor (ECF subfamily)